MTNNIMGMAKGYEFGTVKEMEAFFSTNPGLRSRVPHIIRFKDYSAEEMVQIAEFESRKRGFGICPEAKEKLLAMCGKAVGRPDLGNGRFCRNLVENAMMSYAERMYGESGGKAGEEFVLAAEDFHFPEELKDERVTMGFRV